MKVLFTSVTGESGSCVVSAFRRTNVSSEGFRLNLAVVRP
jgi:hypothetical protein